MKTNKQKKLYFELKSVFLHDHFSLNTTSFPDLTANMLKVANLPNKNELSDQDYCKLFLIFPFIPGPIVFVDSE